MAFHPFGLSVAMGGVREMSRRSYAYRFIYALEADSYEALKVTINLYFQTAARFNPTVVHVRTVGGRCEAWIERDKDDPVGKEENEIS